ncbi:MAG: CBS domain-containing protein [Promethearchaeota archaeon]
MSISNIEYKISDLVIDDEYGVIESSASVVEAAKKMKEINIPDLVVIDNESKAILGVVGDFDIVQNIVAEGKDPAETSVKMAMYVIPSVDLQTSVVEAFSRMQKLNVNVVPVVEKGKLLGVASLQDCWNYIPEENEDDIGLIKVHNPKLAEFWFTCVTSILAFVLGVVFPMVGVSGYFSAETSAVSNLFHIIDIRGSPILFTLFEAHNHSFFMSNFELAKLSNFWWVLIAITSILLVIAGILMFISLIYSSYSDLQHLQSGRVVRVIIPLVFIGLCLLQWLFFALGFITVTPAVAVSINWMGAIFTFLAILLVIAAIFRDQTFRQSGKQENQGVKESN